MLRLSVIALLSAACFGPSIPEGLSCTDGLCPSGQVCDPVDDRCRFVRGDADADTDSDGNPGTDGPVGLGCLDPDIILCFNFEGDADDSSSLDRGTISFAPLYAPGLFGQALLLAPGSEVFIQSYIDSSPGPETIEWWFFHNSDGRLLTSELFSADATSGSLNFDFVGASLSAGTSGGDWVHFAVSLGTGIRLHVNGNQSVGAGTMVGPQTSPGLSIGSRTGTFAGRVDSFRVWKRELSSTEIAAIASRRP